MAPDGTNNSINAEIDGGTCFNVGGGSAITANSWTWVNYQNGSPSSTNTVSLTSGNHSIKLIGTMPGVSVDRIELTTDTSCIPVGTGDTCVTPDTTPPVVSITSPSNGATVSGSSVTVSANATDNVGVAGVQFKLDNNNLGSEDTTSPYSISWNATQAINGSHTITAVARDAAGNTTTSSVINVSVTGGVAAKIGDLNKDGAVNAFDLSILLKNWNTSDSNSDLNSDGVVNVFDLAIFISHYGG